MSENTNTLFWVICGAVIVIAIFTLVNVTSNQTINKIFKKYKNEYREIVPAKANYPLTKENWSVDIVSLINSRLTFLATNLKGKPQYVNEIDIKFFNCNTDDLITTFNQEIKMNINTGLQGSGGLYNANLLKDIVYCIDFTIT